MPKIHTEVIVQKLPNCDFCENMGVKTKAAYDGKTTFGPWAWMCEEHFKQYGTGLGLGIGQRLVTKGGKNDRIKRC